MLVIPVVWNGVAETVRIEKCDQCLALVLPLDLAEHKRKVHGKESE